MFKEAEISKAFGLSKRLSASIPQSMLIESIGNQRRSPALDAKEDAAGMSSLSCVACVPI